MLDNSLPCPECHEKIKLSPWTGGKNIKECPSCHTKIKFKKASFKEIVKETGGRFLVSLAISVVFAAVAFSIGLSQMVINLVSILIVMGIWYPKMHAMLSFEKDE